MQSQTALVSREDVRDALRHLSRDRTPGRTPLLGLEVVRRAVDSGGLYPSRGAREFEVARLLTETVEDELRRLRSTLRGPASREPRDVRARVRADFHAGHRELESWSAVYHLYVRPDLNIGLDDLEELLGDRHRRTLQRRLQEGVTALAMRLQSLETRAAVEARRERLRSQLPVTLGVTVVARDAVTSALRRMIADDCSAMPIAIGGTGGVGKSAVVRHVVSQMIEDDLQGVIWLPAGEALAHESMAQAIGRSLDEGDDRRAGAFWARSSRNLLVVDGVDGQADAERVLRRIETLRSRCRVVMTGRLMWSGLREVRPVLLRPLPPHAATQLLRSHALERGLPDVARADDEVLAPVVEATGGLPAALCLAVAQLRASDVGAVVSDFIACDEAVRRLCRDLWHDAWEQTTDEGRQVLLAVIEARRRGLRSDAQRIADIAGMDTGDVLHPLRDLADRCLLDAMGDVSDRLYRPWPFLRRYLQTLRASAS